MPTSTHPLADARTELVNALTAMGVPRYPMFPLPEHHEAMGDHVRAVTAIFHKYWAEIGYQFAQNSSCSVATYMFDEPLHDAASDAVGEMTRVAEQLREEQQGEWSPLGMVG